MRKLTDSDKQEILKFYRETAETTSTLADRYGVSNSTISRLLKSTLPEDEYEYLVSLKRAARTPEGRAQVSYEQLPLLNQHQSVEEELPSPPVEQQEIGSDTDEPKLDDGIESLPAIRRVKKRSSAAEKPAPPILRDSGVIKPKPPEIASIPSPILEDEHPEAIAIAHMLGEELLDESEDLDDLDDEDFEEDDDDDEDFEEPKPLVARRRPGEAPVQVLPLSIAHLPKTCYLVIDRASELITRPLKDFGDLGQIPIIETQQRTLPVFDNHRVAKRFSTKRDSGD